MGSRRSRQSSPGADIIKTGAFNFDYAIESGEHNFENNPFAINGGQMANVIGLRSADKLPEYMGKTEKSLN